MDIDDQLARRRARDPERGRLYAEFESYYVAHRCRWAPENPRRVFNLCVHVVYRRYRKRLTLPAFLSVVYATLGIPFDESRPHTDADKRRLHGMFQKFDPAKYRGVLPIEDHFINLLRRKVEGRLLRYLQAPTDTGNRGDDGLFRAWDAQRRLDDLAEGIPDAMRTLDDDEHLYNSDDILGWVV